MSTEFQYTSIELKIKKILDELKIEYKYQYLFNDSILCDFAIPALKLIIECDGCYWHSCPMHHPKAKITNDKERNKYVAYFGWKTLRFWEHEINNNIEYCLETIQDALYNHQRRSRMASKNILYQR